MEDLRKTLVHGQPTGKDAKAISGKIGKEKMEDAARAASVSSFEIHDPWVYSQCMLKNDLFLRLFLHPNCYQQISDEKVLEHYNALKAFIERLENLQRCGLKLPEAYEALSTSVCHRNISDAYDLLKTKSARDDYAKRQNKERIETAYADLEELIFAIKKNGVVHSADEELVMSKGKKLGYSKSEIDLLMELVFKNIPRKEPAPLQTVTPVKPQKSSSEPILNSKEKSAAEQNQIGLNYLHNKNNPPNYTMAFSYFNIAAELGSAEANFHLGRCYYHGWGVFRDDNRAFHYYSKASLLGYTTATFYVGVCYEKGIGVAPNPQQAFDYYTKAAEQNNSEAQCKLALCYQTGIGTIQNNQRAFQLYFSAAENGLRSAEFAVGECYNTGLGTEKNPGLALKYYKKAAQQGYADAEFKLGIIYKEGNGVTKNNKTAFAYFENAAKKGHREAQYYAGYCLENGFGTMRSATKALVYYQQAAENGNADAQCHLGRFYQKGIGTVSDFNRAFEFYKAAALQEHHEAQFYLANCFDKGTGTPINLQRAIEWYIKAAEGGSAQAQAEMGYRFLYGTGVEKNEAKGLFYLNNAAQQGHSKVQKFLVDFKNKQSKVIVISSQVTSESKSTKKARVKIVKADSLLFRFIKWIKNKLHNPKSKALSSGKKRLFGKSRGFSKSNPIVVGSHQIINEQHKNNNKPKTKVRTIYVNARNRLK